MDSLQTPRRAGRMRIAAGLTVVLLIALVVVVDAKRQHAGDAPLAGQTQLLSEQDRKNRDKAQQIVAAVGALYALPPDAAPTVAAVVDAARLRTQNPLYARAENGHYVVVAGDRAILYDPSKGVIVDVILMDQMARGSAKSGDSR